MKTQRRFQFLLRLTTVAILIFVTQGVILAQTPVPPLKAALKQWWDYRSDLLGGNWCVPFALAFDGDNMWMAMKVGGWGAVKMRADDVNGAVFSTPFSLPSGVKDMIYDGASLWVTMTSSHQVRKLNPNDGTIEGTYPSNYPEKFAFDGTNMWVTDSGDGLLWKRHASDAALLGIYHTGTTPAGVVFDGTSIWVANKGSNTVMKFRPSDGVVLGTFPVGPSPDGLVFDGTSIWVANSGSNSVTKLRASDGATLGTFLTGSNPSQLAFDATYIYVGSNTALDRLRASDGAAMGSFALSSRPTHLVFDGRHVWFTLSNDHGFVDVVNGIFH